MRIQRQRTFDADGVADISARLVGAFVQEVATQGEGIVRPNTVEVDERCLPRAISEVLEGGDGEGVCQHQRSRLTPGGTSCSFNVTL